MNKEETLTCKEFYLEDTQDELIIKMNGRKSQKFPIVKSFSYKIDVNKDKGLRTCKIAYLDQDMKFHLMTIKGIVRVKAGNFELSDSGDNIPLRTHIKFNGNEPEETIQSFNYNIKWSKYSIPLEKINLTYKRRFLL